MGIFGSKKPTVFKEEGSAHHLILCFLGVWPQCFYYLKGVLFKPRITIGITLYAPSSPVWYSKYTVQLKCWDSPKALSINVILVLNK